MKFLIFKLVLRPLILRDFRLRGLGLKPDKWYWADELAMTWGFYVSFEELKK